MHLWRIWISSHLSCPGASQVIWLIIISSALLSLNCSDRCCISCIKWLGRPDHPRFPSEWNAHIVMSEIGAVNSRGMQPVYCCAHVRTCHFQQQQQHHASWWPKQHHQQAGCPHAQRRLFVSGRRHRDGGAGLPVRLWRTHSHLVFPQTLYLCVLRVVMLSAGNVRAAGEEKPPEDQ